MITDFAFLDIGTPELIIILVIILLLFGSKKLPQLTKSINESMHELKKGVNSDNKNEKEKTKNTNETSDKGGQ